MKVEFRNIVSCVLLVCCTFAVSTELVVSGLSMPIDHSGRSSHNDDPSSHPFDQRPVVTQRTRTIPLLASATSPIAFAARLYIVEFDKKAIVSLPIIFSTIISHFPGSPFRPRDPSLV